MIKKNATDHFLLATCLGDDDTGGGLFTYDGARLEQVDRLSSTGLTIASAGDRLLRLVWSSGQPSVGELLVYDCHGVERYYRIDELVEPHDITWALDHFIIVSTANNTILWLSPSGEIFKKWQAAGHGDSWHLNSLYINDSEVYACAFGSFERHREWTEHKTDGSGFLFHLGTKEKILTNLNCPHTPRFFDGAWTVCDSASHHLLQIDRFSQAIRRRLRLNGWTRGIAVADNFLFVGESANRSDPQPAATASIAVISRQTWTLVGRIPLPCREIYDLLLVGNSLVEGVRRGFRTNPLRAAEQDQYAMFREVGVKPSRLWAIAEPLPAAAMKVKIEADLPSQMDVHATIELECLIENLGTAFFISAPPYPVHISYKWIEPNSGQPVEGVEGLRSRLPQPLPPRQPVRCRFAVTSLPTEGDFLLRVTLVQEAVAWFEDIDPANSVSSLVHVGTPVLAASDTASP